MKKLSVLLALTFVGLRYASNRLAQHQTVLPSLRRRINTQVRRINQR